MHNIQHPAKELPSTRPDPRPLATILLPAFNEAAILEENLALIQDYLRTLADRYRFEVLIVDDGSMDGTGRIAEAQSERYANVRVIHHPMNRGLGRGFQTGFAHSRGDYIVILDIDLSYSPDHIGALLESIRTTGAEMVLASPYMKGGRISNVPWLRRALSVWANRFLSYFAKGRLSTLTCMVRAYDGEFARSLVLRSAGMDVMPESIYKPMILRARIEQVAAHLDWSRQVAVGTRRRSSMRIMRHMLSTVLSGFIFRPFMFFIAPGLLLGAFAVWTNFWMVTHFLTAYRRADVSAEADRISAAIAFAYQQYPHTFIVGLLSLMLSVQLLSLGILALQSKRYFEETFYLASAVKRSVDRKDPRE